MGGQQGDDGQFNGDVACENLEVRSQLTVAGVPVTPGPTGVQAKSNGVPVPGGPFTILDFIAPLGAANAGGGELAVGDAATSDKQILVFAPGLVAPVAPYYNTWAAVEAQVNALDGACQLWIDMTGLGGFAQIPPTANLDGKGRLEIIGKGPQGEAEMVMQDGAQIKNVQCWRTIVVRGNGNVRPSIVYDIDGMIVETFDATFLYNAAVTQPVIQLGAITYISLFFSESSELRNSHNPGVAVLDLGTNPGVLCLLTIDTLFYPSSFDDTIGTADPGHTLDLQCDLSVPLISLSAFAGTFNQTYIDKVYTDGVTVLGDGTPFARLQAPNQFPDIKDFPAKQNPNAPLPGAVEIGDPGQPAQIGKSLNVSCLTVNAEFGFGQYGSVTPNPFVGGDVTLAGATQWTFSMAGAATCTGIIADPPTASLSNNNTSGTILGSNVKILFVSGIGNLTLQHNAHGAGDTRNWILPGGVNRVYQVNSVIFAIFIGGAWSVIV